jgi:hypothetical protein
MTSSIGLAAPDPISGGTRQEAREARRRQRVMMLVMLAAAARVAVDRRTLAGLITLGIGLAAAKGLASDRGTPALDWYRARGRDSGRPSASRN